MCRTVPIWCSIDSYGEICFIAFIPTLEYSGHITVVTYCYVIMGAMASQITILTIVYSTVYSIADQRKHQSSASLAFVRGIHRWPVNFPHKGTVTRKMIPFDDVIMQIKLLPLLLRPLILTSSDQQQQKLCYVSISSRNYFGGSAQGCSNSIALAMELRQSCAKPSTYHALLYFWMLFWEYVNIITWFGLNMHQDR